MVAYLPSVRRMGTPLKRFDNEITGTSPHAAL